MEYKPYCHKDSIKQGQGKIALVTGWYPFDKLSNKVPEHLYNCSASLYSAKRGINPLVRNLLANKHIHHLVVIAVTPQDETSGSCQCLRDFFDYGCYADTQDLGREVWKINSSIEGYIDITIPLSELEGLRHNVTLTYIHSSPTLKDLPTILNQLNSTEDLKPWGENRIFPFEEIQTELIPADRYSHSIKAKTIADAWPSVLYHIRKFGLVRDSLKRGFWQELINMSVVITDEPPELYFPEPNYLSCDRSYLEEYKHHIISDTSSELQVKYTYGSRLRSWFGVDQIQQVIDKLGEQPDAASASMNLWDATTDHIGRGSPCLNHIWVRIVETELVLIATLRSNDMFSAWPSNSMGLRLLQQHICDEINQRYHHSFTVGNLIINSQSAHIYKDCWEFADSLISKHYLKPKKLKYNDPCGIFLISLSTEKEKKVIKVEQYDTNEQLIRTYSSSSALKLVRQISRTNPTIQPDHIGYLGVELHRAQHCITTDSDFIQDK